MSSECRREGSKVFVRFNGEIDLVNINELKELLFSLSSEDVDIELDASRVEFLHSSGIGMLVLVRKMQKEKGHTFCLVNIPERVKRGLTPGTVDLLQC